MQEKKEEDLQQALNKLSEVGIDEVGRGAIFGPVFSAVVVCIYGRFPYVILILEIFTAHFL